MPPVTLNAPLPPPPPRLPRDDAACVVASAGDGDQRVRPYRPRPVDVERDGLAVAAVAARAAQTDAEEASRRAVLGHRDAARDVEAPAPPPPPTLCARMPSLLSPAAAVVPVTSSLTMPAAPPAPPEPPMPILIAPAMLPEMPMPPETLNPPVLAAAAQTLRRIAVDWLPRGQPTLPVTVARRAWRRRRRARAAQADRERARGRCRRSSPRPRR